MDGLRFEPLSLADVEDVRALARDPLVHRYTRFPPPDPPDLSEYWIDWYMAGWRRGTHHAHAARLGAGGFVGLALVPRFDELAAEAELVFIVAPEARGIGVGAGILALLTAWVIEDGEALRAQLSIDVTNRAAERVAERCGYVREGVLRSVHFKPGVRIDAGVWSRLASPE